MTSARFGLQALIVLALVALVSWPEQRQVRAGTFWQVDGPLAVRGAGAAARPGTVRRSLIGYGSASEFTLGSGQASALQRKLYGDDVEGSRRRVLPERLLALGGRLNGVVGYVRTAMSAAMPYARVVLRNLATGAVEARGIADEDGLFTFLDVMPGSGYVVEVLDENGAVVATSELLAVAAGELRETSVRMPGQQIFAAFGGAVDPTAHEPVNAAADQGVSRVTAPERCASPPCDSANP